MRYNFHIRGLPDTEKDITTIAYALIQSATPDVDEIHMEIDDIHRALVPPKPEGPPRGVIVKPNFFRIKEAVMHYAREHPDLEINGYKIHVFADISQATIQKRRSFKPLLSPLIDRNIRYRWNYPFRL